MQEKFPMQNPHVAMSVWFSVQPAALIDSYLTGGMMQDWSLGWELQPICSGLHLWTTFHATCQGSHHESSNTLNLRVWFLLWSTCFHVYLIQFLLQVFFCCQFYIFSTLALRHSPFIAGGKYTYRGFLLVFLFRKIIQQTQRSQSCMNFNFILSAAQRTG